MVAVRVMQVAIDHVIGMLAVGQGGVTAIRAVGV